QLVIPAQNGHRPEQSEEHEYPEAASSEQGLSARWHETRLGEHGRRNAAHGRRSSAAARRDKMASHSRNNSLSSRRSCAVRERCCFAVSSFFVRACLALERRYATPSPSSIFPTWNRRTSFRSRISAPEEKKRDRR